MIISRNLEIRGSFDHSGEIRLLDNGTLEVDTFNNSGNITSPGRMCIKASSTFNNINNGKVEGIVVCFEGNISNSEQATIRGSESLTLPASLIQSLVGAECVTAEAVNSTQRDLAARGGSLIGSTLTVNPLR